MILKDFFTYAIGKYKLPVNPTLSTTRPEVVQKEMRVLSPDEMQVFMEEVMKETQRIAILTDLFLGLRMGELLALQISDLNLQRQTLTVNKNLIRVNTESLSLDNPNIKILSYNPAKKTHLIVQNTPKTKSSNREIAISDGLCELLVRHIFTLSHSSWPNPNNLLFPSKARDPHRSPEFSTPVDRCLQAMRDQEGQPARAPAYAGDPSGGGKDAAEYRAGYFGSLIHRNNQKISA